MSRWHRVRLVLTALLLLGLLPSIARAQFRRVVVSPQPVARSWWGPRFYPVPVANFNTSSYLHGVAAVVDAQGRYAINSQQAFLLREQVRAAQIDNRQRVFEQWNYEQANTPTLEEQREFRQQQEFWRSWNDPPLTEIWSGTALNNLLRAIQRARSEEGYLGGFVPLSPELVSKINVSSGRSGSLGVFRQGQDLRWPLALRRDIFDKERKEIDRLSNAAVTQVAAGKPDAQTLDGLSQANTRLRQLLRENVRELPASDYFEALRFTNQLIDSTRTLRSAEAASFFTDRNLTATDVGELITQMTKQGLQFAPATVGDEAAYTALHRALVNYGAGLPIISLRELRTQFYSIGNR